MFTDCTVICGPGGDCPGGLTCQDGLCAKPRAELLICPGGTTRRLAVGGEHACLIKYDGSLWCWGANDHGQLGDGTTSDSNIPVNTDGQIDWVSLAAGPSHSCGLRSDGSAWCWGDNVDGQLGVGDLQPRSSPVPVTGDPGWVSISAGVGRTCGARTDGTVWCWGGGVPSPSPMPAVTGELVQVGDSELCTLGADRTISCNGSAVGSGGWETLSVGAAHACAIDTSGALSCWGDNDSGQLGDGTTSSSQTPVAVGAGFAQVSAGAAQTCAIDTAGALSCWGANDSGQIGDGTTDPRPSPVPVGSVAAEWLLIRTGGASSCGAQTDGTVWCWGNNDHGQLGDMTNQSHSVPTGVVFQ